MLCVLWNEMVVSKYVGRRIIHTNTSAYQNQPQHLLRRKNLQTAKGIENGRTSKPFNNNKNYGENEEQKRHTGTWAEKKIAFQ